MIEASGIKRRKNVRIPEQRFPRRVQIQYAASLQKYQDMVNEWIEELVLTQLGVLVPERVDGFFRRDSAAIGASPNNTAISRFDIDDDVVDRVMQQLRGRLRLEVDLEPDINKAGQEVSAWQKREFDNQIQTASGAPVAGPRLPAINIAASEPGLAAQLQEFLRSNTRLITKMTNNQLDEVETIIRNGRRRGLRVEVLRKQIADRMDITKNRAYLIARDQVNKLNGELNQMRQESVGIEEYVWRTSQDERVRPRHRELDGTKQKWNDPPQLRADFSGHPGEDFQCRCFAEPVLDHLIPE
jgi:SPP1 gp7 family putative phage head morphogenesis protein